MRQMRVILSISAMLLALTSCDPAKIIFLKNRTDKPAYFRWTIHADSATAVAGQSLKTETFNLGTSKSDRDNVIPFGLGYWPTGEVERFVNEEVQSIEIGSQGATRVITDKQEMKDFLLERRHGIFKNFITIRIE